MTKFRLYWALYKSTLSINIITSCFVTLVISMAPSMLEINPAVVFALGNVTTGPFCAILYKEITRRNEYYFYYNKSISKTKLLTSCMVFGIPLSVLVFLTSIVISSYF